MAVGGGGGIPLNNIKSSPPLTSCGLYVFEKYKRPSTSFTTVEENQIDSEEIDSEVIS